MGVGASESLMENMGLESLECEEVKEETKEETKEEVKEEVKEEDEII